MTIPHILLYRTIGPLLYHNICLVDMNAFAKFDEFPSMIPQDIKETKLYGQMDACRHGQCECNIHTHKHSLQGV